MKTQNLFGKLIAEELINLKMATSDTIEGCNDEEIEALKTIQGIDFLPKLYVEYLTVLGKRAGRLHIGSDCFYPSLLKLKEWAEELLAENDYPFSLPTDAFVLFMHQGY